MISPVLSQRLARTSAVLLVVVALVVAVGVIPMVKDDMQRGATPGQAVPAFWFTVGVNVLGAAALWLLIFRPGSRSPGATFIPRLGAFVALLLAIALVDAAAAYGGHGPAMRTATILLFCCAAAEAVAAVLMSAASLGHTTPAKDHPHST